MDNNVDKAMQMDDTKPTTCMTVNAEAFEKCMILMQRLPEPLDFKKKFRVVLEHDPEDAAVEIHYFIEQSNICDKCKQSKSETDIFSIDISYKIKTQSSYYHSVSAKKDICKQCLDKLGLLTELPSKDTDEMAKKNAKTFEDKFVDLLCDLGVQFEE